MENSNENPNGNKNFTDDVKDFYTGDFKAILTKIFTNPIDGLNSIFKNPSANAHKHALILFATVFVLYFLGSYLLAGDFRSMMGIGTFIQVGLAAVLVMFFITALSFGVKSISGSPSFKNELLTGAMCGIPLALLIPILFLLKMFGGDGILAMAGMPGAGGGGSDIMAVAGVVLLLYILLMMINVFQQSLKSSGTKDALAWYLSPLAIILAIYLSSKVLSVIF